MKKLITLLVVCIGMTFAVSAQTVQSACQAGLINALYVHNDQNGCENTEFYPNPGVLATTDINVDINYIPNGTFVWKVSKNGGLTYGSISSVWTMNSYGSLNGLATAKDNGIYRVIYTDAVTHCKDTAFVTLALKKAPHLSIKSIDVCDGSSIKVTVTDSLNWTWTGNTAKWFNNGTGMYQSGNRTSTQNQGYVSVRVTNANGCAAQYDAYNVMNTTGTLFDTLVANKTKIAPGGVDYAVLTASSNYQATYKWYLNNVLIVGATACTYNAHDTGQYRVRIYNANGGCITNLYKRIRYSSSARVGDDGAELVGGELKSFPNPAIDQITITGHEKRIEIYDMTGKLVKSDESLEVEYVMSVSDMPNGFYVIRSYDPEDVSSMQSFKLVVQR